MLGRFPHLSKLAIKILEIGGAGCASAVAASLLSTAHEPANPPAAVPPAIVRLAPTDEQMIRHVREENAALVEKLRTATDAHSMGPGPGPGSAPAASGAAAASAPTARPVKAASSPPPRREQKPARGQTEAKSEAKPEAKQRAPEPLAAQASSSLPSQRVISAAGNDARDERVTSVAAAPNEWPNTPTLVPSRLWSGASTSLRDAPRPPVGVGEFLSSSM